ncbi:MAG: serine hydrolase [Parvularculaceae bacterium]|nr:serine hydrolase [Parvularculaceae bacterium]
MKKTLLIATALIAVAAMALGVKRLDAMARVGDGYLAKIACSEVFVAGRDGETVLSDDFNDISPLFDFVSTNIDHEARSVSANLLGLGAATASYRPDYGCTLHIGGAPDALPAIERFFATDSPIEPYEDEDIKSMIAKILAEEMANGAANHRSLLVLANGRLVAEAYADGFDANTPFLSWSMAKSVTATMIGAAVQQGLIDIHDRAPVELWAHDDRAAITWNDLLQMQSGLAFEEDYADPLSDVNEMLFASRDAGMAAANAPLAHAPGTFWSYSSGTTNLIQRTLRHVLESRGVNYHAFAYDNIFAPLDATSFVIEPDPSGTFIGSSFVYATARDWARLGDLYAKDGVWNGTRILPEGWADYVATPAAASDRFYGAQFWLNYEGFDGRRRYMPALPQSTFLMAGHEGQYVAILPEENIVIVRTGMTRGREPMPEIAPVFAKIYAAFDQ